ncbi:hypothetical protein ALQ20_102219 [Pseudomonas syringae pv. atrofaciens]|uniref:Uncharacterized protein n=1 Tax=Pseudomonas syringae pv. aceris TaxID=199198 RepID=A0A0P9ICM3_PSESX|nr:hypothetical protein ALO91_102122 [Pseudomonas syringae pv. aceris]KPY67116.1 hypothetical protein ALO45_101455 [Pseudomonas syringae pv. syringae]RML35018.1 hypothetical protein ALQ96_101493 [Pseudomonas syringae pv. atrofaciens]RMM27965.1 hypothetical protein ALQ82_101395 [Pseudomonas syringae pv. pisi]RML74324.1 hypothetical protein ALQ91_101469 [Pseudomonas syringae pv. syringae]
MEASWSTVIVLSIALYLFSESIQVRRTAAADRSRRRLFNSANGEESTP